MHIGLWDFFPIAFYLHTEVFEMSLINIQNLTFTYDGSYTPVFENVSFQIDTNWKLGFIGRNGRGKTTFLNLLLGKYEYHGKIFSTVKFTYFPFVIADKSRLSCEILWEICPDAEEWEIIRELSYLRVKSEALYRSFESLSSGEQVKVLLAGLFLNKENFLLIDEPTNHLDTEARTVVSEYLKKKKGFILVSHDRAFIDGCVDHILSINKTNIEIQSGNFSSWHENFERRQAFELSQNERLQKDIDRLSEAAKRTSAWSDKAEAGKFGVQSSGLKADRGYVGHKAAKMMKRAKATEQRQEQAIEEKSKLLKNTELNEDLKIFPLPYHSERMITALDVEILYGERRICKPITFELLQGERIALCGKNGCGKSSMLKLIIGENIKHSGVFAVSSGLIISYISQTTDELCGKLSEYAKENNIDESLFKAILRKMDFSRADFERNISDYSGGQKKKVLIAKSLCEKAHLYVWDEPLNYIDIYSRIQIENLLKEFKPTMVFVEHDKAFQNAIATKIINI